VSAEPRGVVDDPALIAEGWQRRFVADLKRAEEAREIFSELGLEVFVKPLQPEDMTAACMAGAAAGGGCQVVIYTRSASQ